MSFDPTTSKGFVVERITERSYSTWWYGPSSGWGTTSGALDYSVEVFATKRFAIDQAARFYPRNQIKVWPVKDAIEKSIAEAERRRDEVLASDRDDKQQIADANTARIAYLRGETVGSNS